jgi:hypothetical protein
MVRQFLLGLAFALGLLSCDAGERQYVCLDPAFTSAERGMMQTAIDRWHDFTGGRADLTISCEGTPVNVHKVYSTDPGVQREDARIGLELCGLTESYGHIYIVVDRCVDIERQIMQHELGHFIELRWPNCDNSTTCVHVPDSMAPAIMTSAQSGAIEFTPSDYAFCVAGGFCVPGRLDQKGISSSPMLPPPKSPSVADGPAGRLLGGRLSAPSSWLPF